VKVSCCVCVSRQCLLGQGRLAQCAHNGKLMACRCMLTCGLCDCLSCRLMSGMSVMRQLVCLGSGWRLLGCWVLSRMH
jgi:hypothetical protein